MLGVSAVMARVSVTLNNNTLVWNGKCKLNIGWVCNIGTKGVIQEVITHCSNRRAADFAFETFFTVKFEYSMPQIFWNEKYQDALKIVMI
jgi:hypothetical protein